LAGIQSIGVPGRWIATVRFTIHLALRHLHCLASGRKLIGSISASDRPHAGEHQRLQHWSRQGRWFPTSTNITTYREAHNACKGYDKARHSPVAADNRAFRSEYDESWGCRAREGTGAKSGERLTGCGVIGSVDRQSAEPSLRGFQPGGFCREQVISRSSGSCQTCSVSPFRRLRERFASRAVAQVHCSRCGIPLASRGGSPCFMEANAATVNGAKRNLIGFRRRGGSRKLLMRYARGRKRLRGF